jgi:proteic killer suppression protein
VPLTVQRQVEITFKSKKLKKMCEDYGLAKRHWGEAMAKKIIQRINELQAAETLADLSHQPPMRCHRLSQNREGQYAVSLIEPYRLVFLPLADDGLVLIDVEPVHTKRVKILEVVDYHE